MEVRLERTAGFAGFRPLVSNEEMNDTEVDSSDAASDNEINDIDAAKLDASHREILEKLKRQELEERQEIERELRDAQMEALERARAHEELRAQELRAQELSAELQAQDLRTHAEGGNKEQAREREAQTEIRTQRPPGLLAQHGLTTKHHGHHHGSNHGGSGAHGHRDRDREREPGERERPEQRDRDREREMERRSPHGYLSPQLPGSGHHTPQSFLDRFPRPSPPTPGSTNGDGLGGSPAHHWTFEEQFKQGQGVPQSQLEKQIAQMVPSRKLASSPGSPGPLKATTSASTQSQIAELYELSDDPKRKEFLDDLFSFMQKRGTPVNRIPIMAKQTLDLYELFRLVVSKGGLVEVINKKLWREITKGLNLPSSITSAAFTLRTQYMKYLYPYECEKLKLSSPQELQSAIDGNRREGRRPSYGYDFSPVPTLVPTTPPHLNGGLLNGRPTSDWPLSWKHAPVCLPAGIPMNPHHLNVAKLHNAVTAASETKDNDPNDMTDAWPGLENPCPVPVRTLSPRTANFFLASMRHQQNQHTRHNQHNHSGDEENSIPSTPAHLRSLAERDARAMEAATRAMEEATKRMEQASRTVSPGDKRPDSTPSVKSEEPPAKRPSTEEERLMAHVGVPSAHIKITSRNDGRTEFDNSLVVSMEVNGIMYQGVLFAQHHPPQRRI